MKEMDEPPLMVGRLVKLKSGGPVMVAESATDPYTVMCWWFNGADLRVSTFPANILDILPDIVVGSGSSEASS